ncbi:MAG: hypothetical protein JSS70_09810 [Bacteroidetes bacterium]|nr:hypothetical protein [Bacteroidota bacterium]
MAFLMVVLLIHLVVNLMSNKTNKKNIVEENEGVMDVKHPAEFLLR